jgi:hypothetical protein
MSHLLATVPLTITDLETQRIYENINSISTELGYGGAFQCEVSRVRSAQEVSSFLLLLCVFGHLTTQTRHGSGSKLVVI